MDAFEEGYAFFEKQAGVQFACHEGGVYVDQVDAEIAKLIHDLNAFEGFKTKPDASREILLSSGTQTPLTSMQPPVILRTELL